MQNENPTSPDNTAPKPNTGTEASENPAPMRKRSVIRRLFSRRNLDRLVERYISMLFAIFRIKLPSKKELHQIIFLSNTKAGKRFDIYLMWAIFISVLIPIMDTVNLLSKVPALHYIFYTLEWILTIAFTIEYILRIYCLKKPFRYMVSFFGIIDALSIFPFYLALFFPFFGSVTTIRILRILRVFRVLNMKQFMSDSQSLLLILKNSFRKIVVFMMFVFMAAVILGTIVYTVENGRNPMFTSIPRAIYWAIVTITTVGYGDIAPITATGQIIATISMLLGYSVIAVPTGIIGSEAYAVHRAAAKHKEPVKEPEKNNSNGNKICSHCGATVHMEDAIYCRYCGWKLHTDLFNAILNKTAPKTEEQQEKHEEEEEEEDIR